MDRNNYKIEFEIKFNYNVSSIQIESSKYIDAKALADSGLAPGGENN